MQASLIQDFPKADHSKTSDSTKENRINRPKDSFEKTLNAELQAKEQRSKNLSDTSSNDLDETLWLNHSSSLPSHTNPPSEHKPNSTERSNQEILNPGRQEPGSTKSSAETEPSGPKTDIETKDTNGKRESLEKQESGKNVSKDIPSTQGEAKNTPRPNLGGKNPLTYGSVKPSENMLLNASSAASNSSSVIPLHHGTPHASGNLQVNQSINTQNQRDLHTMSNNTTTNPARIKEEVELDGTRRSILSGNGSSGFGNSTSLGSSLSNGGQEESGAFSDKESGHQPQIQSISRTPFSVPSNSASMVDSVRKIQSMIQDQVVIMKTAPGQPMQVMIRPDANMALFLTLQQNESDVLVGAKMDQSTSNLLKPHWEEIQKELSQQGIRLGNPELHLNQDSSSQQNNSKAYENDDTENIFPLRNQEPTQRKEESNEISEPDFDSMEGTLISWA